MAKNGLMRTKKWSASVLKIIPLEKMAKTLTCMTESAPSKSLELFEERPEGYWKSISKSTDNYFHYNIFKNENTMQTLHKIQLIMNC